VTVPHKEAAFALSEADERARAVGAANTLWLDGGVLRSTNTDVEGFLGQSRRLRAAMGARQRQRVVLGAGGAARGVIHGLLARGIPHIAVANRTPPAPKHCARLSARGCGRSRWEEIGTALCRRSAPGQHHDARHEGAARPRNRGWALAEHAIVADLVYVPVLTPLLSAAKSRGLRTADGLGMLLHQAVRGFALWFGKSRK
jgi:shikimate dehydrogenase